MQVFFDPSLWCRKGRTPCKVRQNIKASFSEGGLNRLIPAVYCFPQGILFDILTIAEGEKIAAYFEKYKGLEEKAHTLSDIQIQRIRQEYPYQDVPLKAVWLNGGKEEH